MNTIITAGFDSFEKADKAMSNIHSRFPHIYCAETTASGSASDKESSPFAVPVNGTDFFRFALIRQRNSEDDDLGAKINIFGNAEQKDEICRIIRKSGGRVENEAFGR